MHSNMNGVGNGGMMQGSGAASYPISYHIHDGVHWIIEWSRWRPVQFGEAGSAINWTVCGHNTISWLPEI